MEYDIDMEDGIWNMVGNYHLYIEYGKYMEYGIWNMHNMDMKSVYICI